VRVSVCVCLRCCVLNWGFIGFIPLGHSSTGHLSHLYLHNYFVGLDIFLDVTKVHQTEMPKNKGKGGKNYKKGKKTNEGETRRELIYKEDGQEYAQVQPISLFEDVAALLLFCCDGGPWRV
jgi:hypothetical protein